MPEILFLQVIIGALCGIAFRISIGILLRKAEGTLEPINWWRVALESVFGFGGAFILAYIPVKLPYIGTYASNLPTVLRGAIGAVFGIALFNNAHKKLNRPEEIFALPVKQLPGLNERQQKAITIIKVKGSISNDEYQQATGATDRTSTRDLEALTKKGILKRTGKGRGIRYQL